MKLCTTLALLLLSTLYFSHGEDLAKQVTMEQGGKTRGEVLAIETNSELVSSSQTQQHSSVPSQCQQDGSTCLTCRSVGMCKGGVLTEVQCRGLYPYCDARTGSCTSERRRCKEEEKAMPCPSKGYFPDTQSCRSFHVCEGDPIISYKFACSALQIYDHEEKKCTRPSFRVRCTSFSCFGKQGRYTPYPSDRSIYTLCADASGTGMFKCPENQEFDESKQKCVASCSSEDNMADIDDESCKKYYRCVKSGRKYEAVLTSCPGQRVFDSEELKCVPHTSSFKCTHPLIGSTTQTTTQATTPQPSVTQAVTSQVSNNEKELSFGETEETFLRGNIQTAKETNEQGKSAFIIGSVYNKEHHILNEDVSKAIAKEAPSHPSKAPSTEHQEMHSEVTTESHLKTTVLETKSSPLILSTSNDNVGAILSMLSDESQKINSQIPSKIVVRETTSDDHSQLNLKSQTSTASLKSTTYPITTEEVKMISSTPLPIKMSLNSHDGSFNTQTSLSENIKTPEATEKNFYRPTTYTPNGKQTYKVITQDFVKTTTTDLKIQHTTQAPVKYITTPNILEVPVTLKKVNAEFHQKQIAESQIPVDIKVENHPTQIFDTKNSEEKTQDKTNLNIGLPSPQNKDDITSAQNKPDVSTNPSQLILKLKGSESNIANLKL